MLRILFIVEFENVVLALKGFYSDSTSVENTYGIKLVVTLSLINIQKRWERKILNKIVCCSINLNVYDFGIITIY